MGLARVDGRRKLVAKAMRSLDKCIVIDRRFSYWDDGEERKSLCRVNAVLYGTTEYIYIYPSPYTKFFVV